MRRRPVSANSSVGSEPVSWLPQNSLRSMKANRREWEMVTGFRCFSMSSREAFSIHAHKQWALNRQHVQHKVVTHNTRGWFWIYASIDLIWQATNQQFTTTQSFVQGLQASKPWDFCQAVLTSIQRQNSFIIPTCACNFRESGRFALNQRSRKPSSPQAMSDICSFDLPVTLVHGTAWPVLDLLTCSIVYIEIACDSQSIISCRQTIIIAILLLRAGIIHCIP